METFESTYTEIEETFGYTDEEFKKALREVTAKAYAIIRQRERDELDPLTEDSRVSDEAFEALYKDIHQGERDKIYSLSHTPTNSAYSSGHGAVRIKGVAKLIVY